MTFFQSCYYITAAILLLVVMSLYICLYMYNDNVKEAGRSSLCANP